MRLVDAATDADGVSPLSEHVLLHLRYGGDKRARNVLLTTGGELTGYAHLDPTDPVSRVGLARALLARGDRNGAREQVTILRRLDPALARQVEPQEEREWQQFAL